MRYFGDRFEDSILVCTTLQDAERWKETVVERSCWLYEDVDPRMDFGTQDANFAVIIALTVETAETSFTGQVSKLSNYAHGKIMGQSIVRNPCL